MFYDLKITFILAFSSMYLERKKPSHDDLFMRAFETFHDYDLTWVLQIHTRFDDLDLVSKVTCVSEI